MNFKAILLISFILLILSLAAASASDLNQAAISDSNSAGSHIADIPLTVSSHDDSVVIDDNVHDVAVDDSSIDDSPSVPVDTDDSSIDDGGSLPVDDDSSADGNKPIHIDPHDDINGDMNDDDTIIIDITNDTRPSNVDNRPISNIKEATGSYDELQSIINLAPAGTTLYLYRDYKGSENKEITVNKNLIIDGQGYTINGARECRIFHSTSGNVVLKNLRLINGYIDGSCPDDWSYFGGAVFIENKAKYTIENCYFNSNWADDHGGAIANLGNQLLTIKNCTFKSNTADDKSGGAIFSLGNLLIEDSTFIENVAYQYGGAIALELANLTKIINCRFDLNRAKEYNGGAIYNLDGELDITGSTFMSNSAPGDGGAVFASGDSLKVKNSIFENNKANGGTIDNPRGGAIFSKIADVYIDNSTFNSNYAANYGGAVYMSYYLSNLFINKDQPYNIGYTTFFSNNVADEHSGGAIYAKCPVSILNAKFTSNKACTTGGAVELSVDSVFDHCFFSSNSCDEGIIQNRGGAIYGDSKVSLYDSIFNNNYAKTDGGAVYSDKTVLAQRCSFDSNRAVGSSVKCYGGAIRAAYAYLLTSTFTKNYSENHGGAVFTDTTPAEIKGCKFIDNRADEDGGAVYINNENTVAFKQCTFISNYAGDEGGAIYLDSMSAHISLINNLFKGNTAKNGKAVYNYGYYDTISSNWWGNENPTTSNHMLVEWHLFSDDYHTDSNPLKMAIYAKDHVVKVGQVARILVYFTNSNGSDFTGVLPTEDVDFTVPDGIKLVSAGNTDNEAYIDFVAEGEGIFDFEATLFGERVYERINAVDSLSSTICKGTDGSQMINACPIGKSMASVVSSLKSVDNPQFSSNFNIMAAFLSLLSIVGL